MLEAPTVVEEGDSLRFVWADIGIGARVERIRLGHDSDLIAEVEWFVITLPDKIGHLHGAKLNLSSTRERASLVRVLSDRTVTHPEIDWAIIVEQLSELTKKNFAEGDPFTTIGMGETAAAHSYLIDRLLEERQITVWYGEGGSLKSYLALAAALSVQGGYDYLGLDMRVGNVLYLDYETDAEEMNDRMRRMVRGKDMGEPDYPLIHYRRQTLPIASDVARLRRFVAQHDIRLVIVDSLGMACGGEPESAEVTLRMYGALRQLGCTVLGIHHVAKTQIEVKGKRSPFGSIFHVNLPRATWEVRTAPETDSDTVEVAMYQRKSNNGRLQRPMGFAVTFEADATRIKKAEISDSAELSQGLSLTEQITVALRSGALSTKELMDHADTTEATIRTALNRGKNRFIRVGDKWGLIASVHSAT